MDEIIGKCQAKDAEVQQAIEERVNAATSLMAQNISQTKLEIQGIKSEVQIAIDSLRAEAQVAGCVSQAHMQQQMIAMKVEAEKVVERAQGNGPRSKESSGKCARQSAGMEGAS